MFLKAEQIRAARAFLDWSQSELASRTKLSVLTIQHAEDGKSDGKGSASTNEKIANVFEKEGLVFTKTGMERRDVAMTMLKGPTWFEDLLDDVYHTLLDKKDAELLIFGGDNKVSPPNVVNLFKKLRNSGIGIREMVEEGNTYLMGPVAEYRWIPSEFYENYVKLIYGHKVCLDFGDTGLLINDNNIANIERNQFELVWKLLPPLTCESTANERY